MGVWKQVGARTYRLNHWALSWIPDYQPNVTHSRSALPGGIDEALNGFGPTNIQETVTLAGATMGIRERSCSRSTSMTARKRRSMTRLTLQWRSSSSVR